MCIYISISNRCYMYWRLFKFKDLIHVHVYLKKVLFEDQGLGNIPHGRHVQKSEVDTNNFIYEYNKWK